MSLLLGIFQMDSKWFQYLGDVQLGHWPTPVKQQGRSPPVHTPCSRSRRPSRHQPCSRRRPAGSGCRRNRWPSEEHRNKDPIPWYTRNQKSNMGSNYNMVISCHFQWWQLIFKATLAVPCCILNRELLSSMLRERRENRETDGEAHRTCHDMPLPSIILLSDRM